MNAVQIIHKHIMLRFCVILLAVFVAFGAFTSTCFADDPLGRQITVAVGGTIGSGLGSLAGGSIAAAGVSAVGLPAAAPIASKVGSGLVGSAGGVVGGLFAGKLYDFLTGYDGAADQDSFDAAYSQWATDNDFTGAYDLEGHYIAYFRPTYSYKDSSFINYSSICEIFNTGSLPCGYYTLKGCLPSYPFSSKISLSFGHSSDGFRDVDSISFSVSSNNAFSQVYDYSIGSTYNSFVVVIASDLDGSYSSSICKSIYSSICASSGSFYVVSNFISNLNKDSSHHIASVSSGTSVGSALISSVGSSNATVGCIDAPSVDKATKFYSVPLVDESNKQLILPDGSVVDFDDLVYDNDKRTYHITYDTSKTYTITYNYDNCVVNDGTTENIYYYAKVDANTPTYDKGGNQINGSGGSGGSTTDPDQPSDGGDKDNGSIWDKVVDAIAALFTAIGKVIGGLLESVINLFTGIVDGLTGCLDLFGSFGEFVAGFYTWMPEEWRTVLAAAFTVFIGLAVIKLFRGS